MSTLNLGVRTLKCTLGDFRNISTISIFLLAVQCHLTIFEISIPKWCKYPIFSSKTNRVLKLIKECQAIRFLLLCQIYSLTYVYQKVYTDRNNFEDSYQSVKHFPDFPLCTELLPLIISYFQKEAIQSSQKVKSGKCFISQQESSKLFLSVQSMFTSSK